MQSTELFELDVVGGAIEQKFRRLRPHADKMPWGTVDRSQFSEAELLAARRGWMDLAVQEYGAAASQSDTTRLLVRARVPLDLSAMIASFPLDELAHTELCTRMAEELGGATPIVYPTTTIFPEPTQGEGSLLAQAARAVAWEYCVGETLSHGLLAFHHRNAQHPLLRSVWGRLAKDEAAHARFGWLFMEWAGPKMDRAERNTVTATIERAIVHVDDLDRKVESLPEESFGPVGVFGSCGREAYLAETRTILEKKIVERLHAFVKG